MEKDTEDVRGGWVGNDINRQYTNALHSQKIQLKNSFVSFKNTLHCNEKYIWFSMHRAPQTLIWVWVRGISLAKVVHWSLCYCSSFEVRTPHSFRKKTGFHEGKLPDESGNAQPHLILQSGIRRWEWGSRERNPCTKRRRVLKGKFTNLERSSVSIEAEMPYVISFHALDQRCLAASLAINLCKRLYQAAFSRARKSNWDLCWESATLYSSGCWDNLNHAKWKTPGERADEICKR